MFSTIKRFIRDKDGAVTVDWVVLTAAIVLIAVAVMSTIIPGVNSTATKINNVVVEAGDIAIGNRTGSTLPDDDDVLN